MDSTDPASIRPLVLATDMDGTLIPTDDDSKSALPKLKQFLDTQHLRLVFVTGRHFASAHAAIAEFDLPIPECIICDVGTGVYRRKGSEFVVDPSYTARLSEVTGGQLASELAERLDTLGQQESAWQMKRQESTKQTPQKLSYYCAAEHAEQVAEAIESELKSNSRPFSVVHSVDPFTGDGLIDVLPKGVAKGFALQWWIASEQLTLDQVVYAGDSGNDTAAFCTGVKSIIVGNAADSLVQQIRQLHPRPQQIHHASHSSTAGVLTGLHHFTA